MRDAGAFALFKLSNKRPTLQEAEAGLDAAGKTASPNRTRSLSRCVNYPASICDFESLDLNQVIH